MRRTLAAVTNICRWPSGSCSVISRLETSVGLLGQRTHYANPPISVTRPNHHDGRVQSRSVSDPQLSISADGGDELRSLLDWLRHEDTLRGRVRSVQEPVRPGQMGGVLDALVMALGSDGAGAVLATSVSTWLSQRHTDVTLTAHDGRTLELDARRVRDPAVLLREVERLLTPEAPQE
ncbi:MAG: effector-associated constant component EACC1 [Pseudonocardiaceae bacterium]